MPSRSAQHGVKRGKGFAVSFPGLLPNHQAPAMALLGLREHTEATPAAKALPRNANPWPGSVQTKVLLGDEDTSGRQGSGTAQMWREQPSQTVQGCPLYIQR